MLRNLLRRKKTDPPNPIIPQKFVGDPCPICGATLFAQKGCCNSTQTQEWITCPACNFRQRKKDA